MMDDPKTTGGSLALIPVAKVTGLMRPIADPDDWEKNWQIYQTAKAKIATPDDKLELETGKMGADNKPEKRVFLKKSYWRKIKDFFGLQVYMISEREVSVGCDPERCPEDCAANHYEVQAMYRAVHTNGSFTDGDGSAVDNEKWGRPRPASEKQIKAIYKQFSDRNADEEAYEGRLDAITSGRTSRVRELSSQEASAFMDYLFGKNPLCQPPKPLRNSRHNVRSLAHTRAYNRAVSNLVGGGEVTADELNERDIEEQRGARGDDTVDAEFTERKDDGAKGAPAAKGGAKAQKPATITPETWEAVRKVAHEIKASGAQMATFIAGVTGNRTSKPAEMTEVEGVKLLENLSALKKELDAKAPPVNQAPVSNDAPETGEASSTASTDPSTDEEEPPDPVQERLVS